MRSLFFWTGLANLLTALGRTPVLGWFADRRRDAAAGALLMAAALAALGGKRPRWWLLPLALPIQLAAASLRGLRHHPLDQFAPGQANRCAALDLPLPDGATLPALLIEPPGGSASGVVFCHGAGNSKTRYAWRALAALRDAGLTVLAIDLDGHGDNPRELRIPEVGENVAAAVAELRRRCDRVGVLGVSFGAAIAVAALAEGIAIDALAIVEMPLRLDLSALPYRRSEALNLLRPAFWRSADRVTPLQLWQGWAGPPMRMAYSLKRAFELLAPERGLPAIGCPTLLLYGAGDVIAPAAPLLDLLPALPDAALHLHPGAGHLALTMEEEPLADLAAWLARHLAA